MRPALHIADDHATPEDEFLDTVQTVFRAFKSRPIWKRRQELRDDLLRAAHKYVDSRVTKSTTKG